ncbi:MULTISPECIES: tRNA (adenosine(37)-N6)-threonylcarbamoyltransferase complex ATPase subunit type 1 TsaE [unclassified Polynucleobacter]|uniref:tRNA (adenosine(37)-N6)-threonylcarbamoyltransferase complex ATPase subunit type 1 TsaE n=1 Tax=unclassified Polynucleobacter TaxID=2640945 RepID=UPI00092632A0|nr:MULTISPECIES: tRNA (adenosine(37)-N6)-threonylcarbamoyltransferase complex ATPase subunit type 1 TsaE [unclassified Polynucleobacter]MBU3641708.1 tRNA (adenosine(37)-N6)-threonylcarbamoyltransferase complex ATPase subunit type 1 TsaE [Polynucleobacter sp. Fuers-14]MEA9568832.1 tRNA (adenosine(37)-N6)-threonylcarbamoyltransferase complex ATPase subunit type 1 TsaE [Polynucleobacter sp. AP-Nickl1-40-C4]OJI04100.1 tRNA (N6-adenosine(37)-N6)-threonylcarbamoyltransferase complex ATPase TsaE [Polyn
MAQTQATTAIPLTAIDLYCRQEADTASLAKQLAASFEHFLTKQPGSHLNISLEGDLGAGKTTFARYLIQALGHEGKVKSPTYTLCEPYPLALKDQAITVHHFDLYRMRDPLEWQEAGFAEHFDVPGICLIEWPEKAEGTLPNFDIQIQLSAGADENERSIKLNALSQSGVSALQGIQPK